MFFNIKSQALKKIFILFLVLIIYNCNKETSLEFEETAIEKNDPVSVEVIYPRLIDESDISQKINIMIESTLAEQIAFFDEDAGSISLDDAVTQFENRFISFKNDFEEDATPWEVTINSEVIFQSLYVITIAIDSYTFTGGAHENSVISFLNFDPMTGNLYSQEDLFNKASEFSELIKQHFKTELESKGINDSENFYLGDDFKLPENIGFNEEGVIFLYNSYEMMSFAQGITEFTVPYNEISKYLKINY